MDRPRVISEILFEGPSYTLIIPVIFVFFVILFGITPLVTQILIKKVCDDIDSDDCDSSEVSSKASAVLFASSLALYVPSIFGCGIYANICDIYGRRYAIIMPLLGMIVYTAGYLYINTFSPTWYFYLSVAVNFVMGMCGGYVTFIMACLCYVSDCTAAAPHTRRLVYSATEASIFVPQIFAPVLSGVWAKFYGFGLPILIGFLLSLCAALYLLTVPESLSPAAESRTKKMEVDPMVTFKNVLFLFQYQCKEGHSPLPWIGGAFFLFFIASLGQTAIRIVYMKHMLDWDAAAIGIYDGLEGLVVSTSMLFVPEFVAGVLGIRWQIVTWIQLGYAFRVLYFVGMGLVRNTLGVFLMLPLLIFIGPLIPFTRTILSNTVPASEQAKIFSAFSAIEGVGGMLAPLFSAAFSVLVKTNYPWMIYEIMAVMTATSFCMIMYVRCTPTISQNLPLERLASEYRKSDESLSYRHFSVTSEDYEVCEEHLQSLLSGISNCEPHLGSISEEGVVPPSRLDQS